MRIKEKKYEAYYYTLTISCCRKHDGKYIIRREALLQEVTALLQGEASLLRHRQGRHPAPLHGAKRQPTAMIEHWYEYLPAAWATPQGRWYVIASVVILVGIAYWVGYYMGRRKI